ncbi:hypothetical protein [Paenibacillus sp. SYP-B4298]|uniref:hypothetical protein n=1 Tax=Paenibacillus sp. SYP-B4298 TaxID=2996034 RepID=UPI0022DE6BC3|nr:hypothetical protein [Paenibacillus sp. SYP-B4298]
MKEYSGCIPSVFVSAGQLISSVSVELVWSVARDKDAALSDECERSSAAKRGGVAQQLGE